MRKINEAGLALLKSFEKCILTAYKDQGGVWTIGWGHVDPTVCEGMTYTQQQADQQLLNDLEGFYVLDHYITDNVNDNQYSALICLAFNVGLRAVRLSNTLRLVNEGVAPDKEWLGFNLVNGQVSAGLIRRREAELELYHSLS
jgi:lysozyme